MPGRQARRARAAGQAKHRFAADLKVYNEMDLENLAKTARLVLCDVGLHQAGKTTWDYQGMTPAAAQQEMEAVLTLVAAEEKRRAGFLKHPGASASTEVDPLDDEHISRLGLDTEDVPDAEDEDLGRGSR